MLCMGQKTATTKTPSHRPLLFTALPISSLKLTNKLSNRFSRI
jgi:hypothetical protein